MCFLLDLVYLVALIFASPWLCYAAIRKGKYRAGYAQKLLGRVPERKNNRRCIWLHGVSVGEVNLLAILIARIEATWPDVECVISTTTLSGYELAKQKYAPRHVFYFPLDFSWAVNTALRRIRPHVLLLAELEIWPNLLAAARRRGVRTGIVNARLSERSAQRYSWIRRVIGPVLQSLDWIGARNTTDAERFIKLGVPPERTTVTGSLKFDGAETDRNNAATCQMRDLWMLQPEDVVFLAGSTQQPEEEFALDCYRKLHTRFPNLRLILVPRHRERFAEVARLLDQSAIPWQRRSELSPGCRRQDARVLLVDTVGELRAWWGTATVGFVGGSLGPRGGQSMIEPAAYGVAVSFGPNTRNFREVVEALLAHDAARELRSGHEMASFVKQCLESPEFAREMGHRARLFVKNQTGAVDRTIALVASILPPTSDAARHAA